MGDSYNWTQHGLTLQQMLEQSSHEGSFYKWVLVDGEYRFIEVLLFGETHAMLLNSGETATDAGSIDVYPDYWINRGYGSTTAACGCSSEAIEALAQLLAETGRNLEHYPRGV